MTFALLARNLRHHGRLLISLLVGFALLEAVICWIGSQIETGPGLEEMIQNFMPAAFREMFLSQIGMSGQLYSVIVAHVVLCTPFAMAIVRLRLSQIEDNLEAAAWNLGASPWRTVGSVIVP